MEPEKSKHFTIIAYTILAVSMLGFISLSSFEWGIFLSWPILLIGFIAWAVLLTIAGRYRTMDKKASYRQNQKIFIVIFAIILAITFLATVGRSLLNL